jgi:hypothetical protein
MKKDKIKVRYILVTIAIFLYSLEFVFGQQYNLPSIRDSLNFYFKSIKIEKEDEIKLHYNEKILRLLRENLSQPPSFKTPIDSVNNMGLIKSENRLLHIYTWNIPFNDGTHKYFGFLHYYSKNQNKPLLYELIDCSEDLKNPEYLILTNKNWYGALVYTIIETKHKGQIYYTLLSADLNDMLTKKKYIDVLQFDENDLPVFGAKIFKNKPKNTRIVFEYNARANMALIFDQPMKMIVFDHLSPSKPSLTGVYEFYGPDFSYDGYKFEKGKWVLFTDIDVRNNKK